MREISFEELKNRIIKIIEEIKESKRKDFVIEKSFDKILIRKKINERKYESLLQVDFNTNLTLWENNLKGKNIIKYFFWNFEGFLKEDELEYFLNNIEYFLNEKIITNIFIKGKIIKIEVVNDEKERISPIRRNYIVNDLLNVCAEGDYLIILNKEYEGKIEWVNLYNKVSPTKVYILDDFDLVKELL